MNQPFEVAGHNVAIKSTYIVDAGKFAGCGLGLPEDFAGQSQEKTDLLERRLSKLERALGLSAICDR